METHKKGIKHTHHIEGKKPEAPREMPGITLPQHAVIAIALLALLLVSLLFPSDITRAMYTIAVLVATLLLIALMVMEVPGFSKDRLNLFAAVAGIMLLIALFGSGSDILLIILFSAYLLLAVLFSGRVMKLQTAIIIAIAITAIIFRVYPAMPGSGGMAGHLISMDDPYYHYKLTNDLYTNGIIEPTDYRVYPPLGWQNSNLFPYYYNNYLARMTGNPLHDIMLLYPVLISAFGAVMMFFLLKELARDWKSGAIGGFLYATMPMLLTKSSAGAAEEDVMGMAMGVFALYLFIKAIRSKGSANIKFAVMAGFAFLILLVTWGGIMFFFAIPFVALGLYAIAALLLKYDIWEVTRAGLISGAILIVGNFLLFGRTDLMQIAPCGFFVFFGVWAEVIRTKYFGGEDNKLSFEKDYIFPFAALITIGLIAFVAVSGIGNIASIPEKALVSFSGSGSYNFLVDKTIAEQGKLASGSLQEKLAAGFGEYGIGEIMTVLMAGAMAILVLFYFFKDREKMFDLLLAYLIGIIFFAVTMTFVWGEARLGFSQALGFVILGAMVGLFLPGSFKELGSFKIITLLIAIVIPLAVFWPNFAGGSYWEMTHRGASVDPAWFKGVQWLESHIHQGSFQGDNYINGDVVFTWWDYGHFITALSHATTATDPTQHDEDYIMRTARFFYNFTTEEDAMNWLENQPFNINDSSGSHKLRWIILDYSLVGKAGALAFLGTNYYEYPNGETAVNGVCSQGDICQNVENGLTADVTNGKYTCKQGVVCQRDALTQVDTKKCCEAEPTQCCDSSFKWTDIDAKGGSARILRSPGTPVYGQYQLSTGNYACRPEYSTSTEPIFLVEDGVRKTVNTRYLYMGYGGLPYGDGVDYPAFVIMTYSDGTQKLRFIASNCDTKEYGEVMGLGKDLLVNMQYGIRLSETAIAPQVFVHVPERWMKSMFTELYLKDAKDLKYFKLVDDAETQKFYPSVKIYEVKYPGELPPEPEVKGAKDGDVVEVDYTGKLENGTIFDSSKGRTPLKFTLGTGQLISGFEEAVYGMEVGQSKEVTIPPEKAYNRDPTHPLYNKTLIFDITVVSINKAEEATTNATQGQLNMTFDYYDPALNKNYTINKFPTVVFNCQYKRFGTMETRQEEIGALSRLFCIASKAVPSDFCSSMGISFNNETGKVVIRDNATKNIASSLVKTGADSCAPSANSTLIQAFYSDTCTDCLSQKELLDSLESALSGYVAVDYYCAGNETYCKSSSASVIA